MKTSTLLAALAVSFAASGAAMAQEASYDYPQPAATQKTRAEVVAELQQARAAGQVLVSEADYNREAPFVAQRSRAEVRAETLAAIASGELRELNRESNAFAPLQRHTPATTVVAAK